MSKTTKDKLDEIGNPIVRFLALCVAVSLTTLVLMIPVVIIVLTLKVLL